MTSPVRPPLHLFALELKEELSFHGSSVSVSRNASYHTNDLSFPKADTNALSRRHARFCITHNQWHIEDLDSKNGTFLNGQRLPPCSQTRRSYPFC